MGFEFDTSPLLARPIPLGNLCCCGFFPSFSLSDTLSFFFLVDLLILKFVARISSL